MPARFPALIVESAEGFRRLRHAQSGLFDERYRREQALGTGDESLALTGTCGLCLRVARFVSSTALGEATADGRVVPNWREQQACDCAHALVSRRRALLHLALSHAGAAGWYRIGVLGQDDAILHYLRAGWPETVGWRRFELGRELLALPEETGALHLVLSADHLQCVAPLDATLAEVARVLSPGGAFVFTVPFSVNEENTRSEPATVHAGQTLLARPLHAFGWDILDKLRRSDFVDCRAHIYWSEEFGYLGTFNVVFEAFR